MEEKKPESRRVFGLGIEQIAQATARVHDKGLEELKRKRRGEQNEARLMGMDLCWSLGGHKHREIGREFGLEKPSSMSSTCLRMKVRMEAERKTARRAGRIEEELAKSGLDVL
jgi:chromosomal replication initiation ATPase DnaA